VLATGQLDYDSLPQCLSAVDPDPGRALDLSAIIACHHPQPAPRICRYSALRCPLVSWLLRPQRLKTHRAPAGSSSTGLARTRTGSLKSPGAWALLTARTWSRCRQPPERKANDMGLGALPRSIPPSAAVLQQTVLPLHRRIWSETRSGDPQGQLT